MQEILCLLLAYWPPQKNCTTGLDTHEAVLMAPLEALEVPNATEFSCTVDPKSDTLGDWWLNPQNVMHLHFLH